jgi:hypothetical protein
VAKDLGGHLSPSRSDENAPQRAGIGVPAPTAQSNSPRGSFSEVGPPQKLAAARRNQCGLEVGGDVEPVAGSVGGELVCDGMFAPDVERGCFLALLVVAGAACVPLGAADDDGFDEAVAGLTGGIVPGIGPRASGGGWANAGAATIVAKVIPKIRALRMVLSFVDA